jgi:hypothetical protein
MIGIDHQPNVASDGLSMPLRLGSFNGGRVITLD